MATSIDSALFEPTASRLQPELLVCAVLHLMSHYSAGSGNGSACIKLASVIQRHLKALADRPDLSPVMRATCEQLSDQWIGVVEREGATPQVSNTGLLSRMMSCGLPSL